MSVFDIARYKIGSSAWLAVLRHPDGRISGDNEISGHSPLNDQNLAWMSERHPKILYEVGPFKKNWRSKSRLPRACGENFQMLMTLLTSKFIIEQFQICNIIRSSNTGEFMYSNDEDEWVHESALFDTRIAAENEHARIIKMIQKWVNSNTDKL
jgi:hypothetical protein